MPLLPFSPEILTSEKGSNEQFGMLMFKICGIGPFNHLGSSLINKLVIITDMDTPDKLRKLLNSCLPIYSLQYSRLAMKAANAKFV